MRILVTGGYGFLGKAISKNVSLSDNFFSFDIVDGNDITSYKAVDLAIKSIKPDVVVHSAAVADLYESDENKERNYKINVGGTYNVSKACSVNQTPMIYISTCCAYGNQGVAVVGTNEHTVPKPTETYAWSKLAGEAVLGCVGPLDAVVLRLGTFYGPDMRPALFNAKAIDHLKSSELLTIHGNGEQTRQYIHVDDVARAVIQSCYRIEKIATRLPEEMMQVINIIGDEQISVNDTISCINNIADFVYNPTSEKYQINYEYVEQRDGQILSQNISNEKAKFLLDWEPKITYEDGIKECMECRINGKRGFE